VRIELLLEPLVMHAPPFASCVYERIPGERKAMRAGRSTLPCAAWHDEHAAPRATWSA